MSSYPMAHRCAAVVMVGTPPGQSCRFRSPSTALSSMLARGFSCGLLILLSSGVQVHGGQRGPDLESFQEVHDNPGHREVAKPLSVSGDDVPGRPLGAAARQGFLVGLDVAVPE